MPSTPTNLNARAFFVDTQKTNPTYLQTIKKSKPNTTNHPIKQTAQTSVYDLSHGQPPPHPYLLGVNDTLNPDTPRHFSTTKQRDYQKENNT